MEVGRLRGVGATAMRNVFTLLLVVVLFSCTVMRSSAAGGAQHEASPRKIGVLSLFNLGLGGKFWNEKVLGREYDDWKVVEGSASGKEALQNFTKAGTIAAYLKLSLVDAIHLPLPINFVFIGFDGEGNQGVKLGEEELERWFVNIDHILEHTRVPQLGEALTPFYRVKGSGERRHHLPFISHAHYNYSVHGIELNSKTTAVFERAIKLLSRKENRSEESHWEVDIGGMSHIFQSLVNYLQLENAYNIFVLNPKRDPSRGNYGYRYGLSESELKLLKENADQRAKLLKSKEVIPDFLAEVEKFKNPLYERHPLLRFSWTTTEEDHTASWVDSINKALDSLEAALLLKSEEELTFRRALQILNGNDVWLASTLRRGLNPKVESGLQPECLVDTWVGQGRWSFLDLTAGPFTWGPTVGGEGVRTELSLPSVDRSFDNLPLSDSEVDTEALYDEFRQLWQNRFSLGEDDQHSVHMLLAEIDVYEVFADKHCKGRRIPLTFCEELQDRVSDVRDELKSIYSDSAYEGAAQKTTDTHKQKAAELLKRIDEWNIFGSVNQHSQNFSVARDSFLAHLGSVLSSSMKHVVTPSTADGAFHYYEAVYFQVYFITQDKVKNDLLLPVDIDGVKAALKGLVLPSQKAFFGLQTYALSEDPALAMAFAASKRAAIVPILLVNGTYKSAHRFYLDSLILQHHIKQLNFEAARKTTGRSTIEIPIFWFLRSSGEPLLVDKHYQAKALPDMVIVVQSTSHAWESHLQCNGEPILWDLRQPSKAAIAAVAEHMAGLLPTHLTYSHAHENSIQDWLWSVGSHPFSSTSAGWYVSEFQNDAIARSYIVTALDESIDMLNSAVSLLTKERTQKATFSAFRAHEESLRYSFNQVIGLWKRIAAFTEELKYGEGLKLLTHLEASTRSFESKVNFTVAAIHPIYCTKQRKLETRMNLATGFGLLAVMILIWLFRRTRRVKPKIN